MIARSSSYAHANTKETSLLEPPQLPAGQITKNGHFGRFFSHFNGFLGTIERNGARGSIPTAILHRKRYVWVTLLNFYFLPTAPTPSSRGGAAGKARPLVRLGDCCPLKRLGP